MTRLRWTPAEVDLLAAMYPHCHTTDVAAWLDRPVPRVYAAAQARDIRKSVEFLASVTAGRIQRGKKHPKMMATQFQPGLVPWNKGTHYVAGGRSAQTRFKPGTKPHTTMPLGSYRINPDGHLQRKVSEARGSNSKRWRNVAELVWVEANGPLPAKHLVVFKPGQRTAKLEEITLDRVECISMAENARRNHPRNRSPELARLVQLKGAITRQVNRITREAEQRSAAA
jgi:hypothetical protein